MQMNQFTAEMLLGNFFDETVLAKYAVDVLGKSGKGKAATLSARIVKVWNTPGFPSMVKSTSTSSPCSNSTDDKTSGNKRKREQCDIDVPKSQGGAQHQTVKSLKHADGEDDGDWMRPLFYWKGGVSLDPDTKVMRWEGSWSSDLASKGLPDADAYEASKKSNAFKLTSKIGDIRGDNKSKTSGIKPTKAGKFEGSPLNSLIGKGGSFKGSYLLDQGDGQGPRKFRDTTHHFTFDSCIKTSGMSANKDETEEGECNRFLLITASGSTKFGNFVSAGYIHAIKKIASETNVELILARRYISDDDSRNSMVKQRASHLILNAELTLDKESDLFWSILLPRHCR